MSYAKFSVAAVALSIIAACGGGDTEDRLDVADPKVRFVDVTPASPAVTLYRDEVAQSDANSVGYKFASAYFDVARDSATWSIRQATAPNTTLASVSFDANQGDRNTILAVPGDNGIEAVRIRDPYNKSLTTSKARVRVVNAAQNAPAVDVYLSDPNVDLAALTPQFPAVLLRQSVPPSDADSVAVSGGNYQLRVTVAGTRTVILSALVNIGDDADWLLVPIPANDDGTSSANQIKLLLVQGNNKTDITSEIVTAQ